MSYYIVDVEADGPLQCINSMVCFGAVKLTPELNTTFYGKTKPISDKWNPDALAVSGFSREEHLTFDDPKEVMLKFKEWIESTTHGKPILISDNNGFDSSWINWYFHYYLGENPFGWSSRRIGDIYSGFKNEMYAKWKWMRKTSHTHNPLNDAIGNAEALLKMIDMGLKLSLK